MRNERKRTKDMRVKIYLFSYFFMKENTLYMEYME